jgi:hypothetical protein
MRFGSNKSTPHFVPTPTLCSVILLITFPRIPFGTRTKPTMKKLIFSASILSLLGFCSVAQAQRPSAPKLFSSKTIAYVRVDDARELKDKLAETAMGKMSQDKDLKPILSTFYGTFSQLVQGMEQEVGVNLDELLSIPNGEMAVAVIPTKTDPAVCVLVEAGSELPAVELMIGKLEKRLKERGNRERTTKQVGKIEVVQYKSAEASRQFGYFVDSGAVVMCSLDYAETLAQIWQGSGIDHTPLSENRDFTSILSKCVGTQGERPQISFYVNPIGIAREGLKRSSSALIAIPAIKTLGLDGFKGVGGSVIMSTEEFDSIAHVHVLMETNRQGVLKALRPKSGSTEPEPFIDDAVVSYSTANWDFQKTIKAVQDVVDTFLGEGAFESNTIASASKALGVDFRKDFLDLLDDRVSLTQMILLPKRLNSQSNLFAIKLKDKEKIKATFLPKIFERAQQSDSRWTKKDTSEDPIYYLAFKSNSDVIRAQQPSFSIIGNYLVFSDSLESIERAVETYQQGEELLSDSIEYKLIRDKIKAQVKGKEFSIMSYQRPDEQLRLFYELAKEPNNVARLEEIGENNPFFGALVAALKSRELPPFEQLSKYMVPTGAFVMEEEDGLHYTAFSLKRE